MAAPRTGDQARIAQRRAETRRPLFRITTYWYTTRLEIRRRSAMLNRRKAAHNYRRSSAARAAARDNVQLYLPWLPEGRDMQ